MNVLQIIISTVLGSFGGAGVVLLGLSGFLGKVWTNHLLEIDRLHYGGKLERLRDELNRKVRQLQADLDKTIFVHKVQFETEFKAMQTIWANITNLRGTMSAVRPTFSTAPENETPDEAQQAFWRRVLAFEKALGDAKDAIFENEPFIPPALYRELYDRLLIAAQAEAISVRTHRKESDPKWYEIGEKNVADLCRSVDRVSALIRERVETLAVMTAG